ncbi:MAG: hypothetical protein JWM53_5726, partial [bacterium]|nr:hypothetical protein [bacterium]
MSATRANVRVGDTLPPVDKAAITTTQLVQYA